MAEADSKPISIFVVVMMDGGPSRWISANSNDTIKSVHYQIREVFGIPLTLQKIYCFGKRLEWCQTLKECSIGDYPCLQVVLRKDGVTRQNSSEALNLVSQIHAMCQRKSVAFDYGCISNKIRDLFSILRQQTMFLLVDLPSSFVTLYENNEEIGDAVIRFFLDSLLKMMLAKGWLDKCASILARLCVYLGSYHGDGNHLYRLCRTHLTELVEKGNYKIKLEYLIHPITSILFYFSDLVESLSIDLDRRPIRDIKAFSLVLCNNIHLRADSTSNYLCNFKHKFSDLLSKTEAYLAHFENFSYMESAYCGYSLYLTILKALHVISKHCMSEELFWNVLRNKRRSLLELIAKSTDRTNDHLWLLERKDVMDSKSRMHLAMMMMTEIRIHEVELYEMLVWSEKLDANLYMAFKNQQITNREVQHYWLRQLCGAIFNPQKSLFLACPNDPKRFYPNPAIEPKTLDLECFKFVGKLVAIALMSEIQIGVAFAHVFLMQLAGRRKISLEEVRDLDPSLHSWCKEIIDGEVIDSEVLEFPEALLGCQWSTELSYVNSKSSREAYVDHLIQHRFVASISEQVSFFIQGFDSVFGTSIARQ
ncbi:E3 ubiquitin-protein ligase UPL5-like [Hevea brasiliensis]|uniref:E3 ubiquitin-protein ligase UPL5-like n=1 Tax=Hevea brasiliensis TaxID=3981 RepID=UPI0025D15814|nr:E3 ubiquitin-protein ligase UPL5-like [Hevea brasiliensis]